MRTVLILLFILFSIQNSNSQTVYFGYPSSKTTLVKGDLIILNVPQHRSGRFNPSSELDKLMKFFKINSTINFKLEINLFYGSEEVNLGYSKDLHNEFLAFFEKANIKNCNIDFNGSNNPFFTDKNSYLYKFYNTRLEIKVIRISDNIKSR